MPPPPIPAAAPRMAGDRYAVVSRIGEGGMSSVYRAYDTKLGVWRAIKMLHPQHARRARLRTRFESEARTMARLEHPNLVRIYDVGAEGKLPFLVMEIVLGGSLQDWTERHGPMPFPVALQATRQVLLGLARCHEAGIVHRDVKPHNVLVAPPGVCKLTDFGIAQIQDDSRTKTGSVLGTQGYMAPEQRLDAKSVDHRADLYGVGAMLWSLLTGRIAQDLYNFGKAPKLAVGIDPVAIPVLTRSLTYGREERYQSADAMREEVEAALASIGSDGREVSELSEDVTRSEKFDPGVMKELTVILAEGRITEDAPEDPDARPATTSNPPPPGAPPKVLPYFMPRAEPTPYRDRRKVEPQEEEGQLPDWIDRGSLHHPDAPAARALPAQSQEVIGLETGSPAPRAATPLAPPRATPPRSAEQPHHLDAKVSAGFSAPASPQAPSTAPAKITSPPTAPDPTTEEPTSEGPAPQQREEEEAPESLGGRVLTLVMVPVAAGLGLLALLGLGLVILVNLSTQQVESAERHAEEARVVFHESLRKEREVVRLMGELGADREELEALYLTWSGLGTEPERTEAGLRFLDLCDAEGRRWIEEQAAIPAQVQATHSLRRLRAARGGFEESMQDWQEAVAGPMGWLATNVGGADSPPHHPGPGPGGPGKGPG